MQPGTAQAPHLLRDRPCPEPLGKLLLAELPVPGPILQARKKACSESSARLSHGHLAQVRYHPLGAGLTPSRAWLGTLRGVLQGRVLGCSRAGKMYASALRCTALQEPAEALAPAWAAARLGWRVTSHVFTAHGMGTLRAPRGSACPASGTSSVQEAEGLGGGLERLPKRLDTDQGGDGEESQKVLTAACFRSCCPALP